MSPESGYLDYLRGLRSRSLPVWLMGAAAILLLLSVVTGWFSVDTTADVYDYDPAAPGGQGPHNLRAVVDVEMRALSLDTRIRPDTFDRRVEEYGKPTYDEHAGRSGTVMLGVLLLSLTTLLALGAFLGFYHWNRKGRRDVGRVARRTGILFLVLAFLTLLYFGVRIADAAQEDTWAILDEYQPNRFVSEFPALNPDQLHPRLGFWFHHWPCCPVPESVYPTSGGEKLVLVEVVSNPSSGFWLFGGGALLSLAGFVLAVRDGQFDPKEPEQELPPTPAPRAATKVA